MDKYINNLATFQCVKTVHLVVTHDTNATIPTKEKAVADSARLTWITCASLLEMNVRQTVVVPQLHLGVRLTSRKLRSKYRWDAKGAVSLEEKLWVDRMRPRRR